MVRRSLKTQPQAIYVYIRTIDTLITLVIDRACNERAEACAIGRGWELFVQAHYVYYTRRKAGLGLD